MAENPYAAPRVKVADLRPTLPEGDFIPGGRGVQAGNGWQWIADAWAFTGDQRWTFVGVFLLLIVIQLVANFVPIVGPLALSLLTPVLMGGFVLGCDAVRRGQQFEVGHLFAGFQRHSGKLLALGAIWLAFGILSAVVMVSIVGASVLPLMVGGAEPAPEEIVGLLQPMLLAVLVILAVSLPLSMAILFAIPLIVLADSDVMSALRTSFFACLKNILPFIVWSLAMLVLAILASIPLMLGWLLLGPISMVSLYVAYRDVFHEI